MKFLLQVTCIVFPILNYGQISEIKPDIIAYYKFTYQADSTDVNSKQSNDMILLHNNNKSYFSDIAFYLRDSIFKEIEQNKMSPEFMLNNMNKFPKPITNFIIEKSFIENKLKFYETIATQSYHFLEKDFCQAWNISKETKRILGYTAEKATCYFKGRYYTAWFTTSIPVPDGPYKFCGLPGLIISISDKDAYFSFVLTSIQLVNQKTMIRYREHANSKLLTKDAFKEVKIKYYENPFANIDPNTIKIDEKSKQELILKMKNNKSIPRNPLELD